MVLIRVQYSSSSERFDATYAESSKHVKSVLASTSTFLSSGISEDVPTGITPKKKNWNVPQAWDRTEPREALLEAFRRRQASAPSPQGETRLSPEIAEIDAVPASAEEVITAIPTVRSSESLASARSDTAPNLATSQIRRKLVGKGLNGEVGKKDERVVVPLGEAGGNIPIPRRIRK